jgi:uncharacterized protein
MKFLLWFAIGFAVIWLLRGKKPHLKADAGQQSSAAPDRIIGAAEPMVRCMHCDIYLPTSETVLSASGDVFCCEEHRSKHLSR